MSSVTFVSHRMIKSVTSFFVVAVLRITRSSTVNNCNTDLKFNTQHLLCCLELLVMLSVVLFNEHKQLISVVALNTTVN